MIRHNMLLFKNITLQPSIILKIVNKKKLLLSIQNISEDWVQKSLEATMPNENIYPRERYQLQHHLHKPSIKYMPLFAIFLSATAVQKMSLPLCTGTCKSTLYAFYTRKITFKKLRQRWWNWLKKCLPWATRIHFVNASCKKNWHFNNIRPYLITWRNIWAARIKNHIFIPTKLCSIDTFCKMYKANHALPLKAGKKIIIIK